LIILVTIGTYFVDGSEASARVAELISSAFPVSRNLVDMNLNRILVIRNSVGALGLIVLMWSGTSAFAMMVHQINSAWPKSEQRNFFERRLIGLAMLIIIILVLFLLMLSSTLLNVLVRYSQSVPGLELLFSTGLWNFGAKVMYWVVPFIFFYSLYRIIPMGRVPIRSAGISAAGITIMWRISSNIFQWYLGSGLARYDVIFGSLSAIVILMLWVYISSLILFFGAHLCAASAGKVVIEPQTAVME
jgi:membrane protein